MGNHITSRLKYKESVVIDSQIKYSNYSQIKSSRKLAEFQNKYTKFNLIYPKFSKKKDAIF